MIEILAPAGSRESLCAALYCGADAVYLGLDGLNARRGADNFDAAGLLEAARLCNERGVKIHLTLNTMLFDSEYREAERILRAACEAGVEALIIEDLGAYRLARACAPSIKLHASTQMSVHSLEGVLQLHEMGFSRAVLARELSLEEIQRICARSPVEIEVFGHGALCMSVSGQCLMSAMIGGRSGNRGMCAQPCRLPYSACGAKEPAHALSLKDLSLLTPRHIQALAAAGVHSVKLEGRMKGPDYVAAAVRAACMAREGKEPDMRLLRGAFSRSGFTDGYFTGRRREMFGVRSKEDAAASAETAGELRRLWKEETGRVPVSIRLRLQKGEPSFLELRDADGHAAVAKGPEPEAALRRPLDEETAARSLLKLGGTPYRAQSLACEIGEGLTLPVSALNALRREAAASLSEQRGALKPWPFQEEGLRREKRPRRTAGEPELRALLSTADGCTPQLLERCALAALYPAQMERLLREDWVKDYLPRLAVRAGAVSFEEEEKFAASLRRLYEAGVRALLCGGLAAIHIGKRLGFRLLGDYTLNVAGTAALEEYAALGLADCTLSAELHAAKLPELGGALPRGLVGYGRLPLMTMRACPVKNAVGCARCRKQGGVLTDRRRARYPVSCGSGVSQLYNCDRLWLADRLDAFRGLDFWWLSFLEETPEEVLRVVKSYENREAPPEGSRFTRGLYFRKVL
ncbi:MAG: U32 family peptidase [Provencibacterium sp.]|nr:U32 family peptidase [Provencibacterium sp.]